MKPYLIDYHVHSRWCGHATGEVHEYVEAAIARGLSEIGLSEHLPVPIPTKVKINLTEAELEHWVAEVLRARDEYRRDIVVRLGSECDFIPGHEHCIERILSRYPFDYVIGSVHFLGQWGFDSPDQIDEYGRRDIFEAYREYFAMAVRAVRSGFFDLFGHADLIKKFGIRPQQACSEMHQELALALSESDMCFEVNTAGMDKPVQEIYPSNDLLLELARRGVPVTLGSDAHAPGEVGRYFDLAVAQLRQAGFTRLVLFENRRRATRPLP